MSDPSCPHCGAKLPMLRPRHARDAAARKVLRRARVAAPVAELAAVYAEISGCAQGSARRAVERLAERGLLERCSEAGVYRASKKISGS